GGCDEGPHYWDYGAGKVFDCLELMESATEGRFDVYGRRLISEMGRYIYRAYIDGSYFLSIADTGGKHILSGYLEFRYGRKIEDERLAALGAWAVAGRRGEGDYCVSGNLGRRLQALWSLRELSEAIEKGAAEPPLVRDVWLDDKDLQFMAARCREGSRKGLYLAAWASHNGQSHNHNDVGNFIVYADGCPIIIDAGVEAYTLKTFGPHRYELWAMQSAYHNLPTVGGVMQKDGREFAARDVEYKKGKSFARLRMDIAGAYPPEAGLGSWVRTVRLNRGEEENISVVDSYELKKARGELTLSLITPCEVTSARPGLLTLKEVRAGRDRQPVHVQMTYDPDKLLARTLEKIPIHSHHEPRFDMRAIWGTDHLTRVVLEARAPGLKNKWELVFTRSQ
ncbi:MAG: heparinase II/III family protein, partial [Gemmatimonadota bacterium]|nr:heparinase II/III family protein [Gemmatimonadota bacterium]